MYFDDSKVNRGLGAIVILISLKGEKHDYVLQIHFVASNNVAEHKAFLHGLWIVVSLDIRRLICVTGILIWQFKS